MTPLVAVSLKMYFDRPRTLAYCEELARWARSTPAVAAGEVRVAVLPDFLTLDAALRVLDGTGTGTARASLTRLVARSAFEATEDSALVPVVSRHTTDVVGAAARRGEPFWTDAGLFAEAGIPCVIVGVGGGGAHAEEAWAATDSIYQLTEILRRTIEEFCA